jgi:hypothetical protein
MELEHQGEEDHAHSPLLRHVTSFSPSEAQAGAAYIAASRATAPLATSCDFLDHDSFADGLEESLLFDYESEAAASVPAAAEWLQGPSLSRLSRDFSRLSRESLPQETIRLESVKQMPDYTVRVEQVG